MEFNIVKDNVMTADSDSFKSDVFGNATLNLNDLYKLRDQELFANSRTIGIILGILIVLSNLVVVVSSGLILKKGQQPKSTYMLLGNVSLADTVVGLFLIYQALDRRSMALTGLCIFKTGMLVCPAIVSIFSVVLIAVDRYCYILHGLYYHRYFTTTKVRISILIIWFCGVTLGFLPATGWVNSNVKEDSLCSYMSLYPEPLVLFNSFVSIIALMIIAVLYSIILIHALRNVKNIRASKITVRNKSDSKVYANNASVNIHRGYNDFNAKTLDTTNNNNELGLKRSMSFSSNRDFQYLIRENLYSKSKSINDLATDVPNKDLDNKNTQRRSTADSEFSITSIALSSSSYQNASSIDVSSKQRIQRVCKSIKENIKSKKKEPSKLRAVIVVSLTSGSIIITWLPFFITVILFVLCENKTNNVQCLQYKYLLGPFITLAFLNSILNPLIYAWWHKGFKKSMKMYYRRYIYNKIISWKKY